MECFAFLVIRATMNLFGLLKSEHHERSVVGPAGRSAFTDAPSGFAD